MLPGFLEHCTYPDIADESRPYEQIISLSRSRWRLIGPLEAWYPAVAESIDEQPVVIAGDL
jgi:hypothetical protein